MYGICTAFITECTRDIPCLYSTCPCIAGHCGHCSSISLYLYEPPPTPILFVAPCQHMLSESSSFPCFRMERNIYYPLQVPSAPTGQISTWKHRFRVESTYAAGRRGSNVYEVNLWLWQIGRGKPLFGGFRTVSVADTEDRRTQL